MSRTESALTTRGVELIRAGRSLRETAGLLGLSTSTLVRACTTGLPISQVSR